MVQLPYRALNLSSTGGRSALSSNKTLSEVERHRTPQSETNGSFGSVAADQHGFSMWVIARKTDPEILGILQGSIREHPWAAHFCHQASPTLISPNVPSSKCRLEPVPFDQCIIDRFFLVHRESSLEYLAGGGITTRICWDGSPETLPPGWQGVVRSSYLDSTASDRRVNTLVPMLAFTTSRYRRQNASGTVLNAMCRSGQEEGFRYAIIPALPPLQFKREYAGISMAELAKLQREDGQPLDHWIRVHLKKGADIIGYCEHSHRFALSLVIFGPTSVRLRFHSRGTTSLRATATWCSDCPETRHGSAFTPTWSARSCHSTGAACG